jgi:glycosyltransferase involved in cell wall biosynthesis
MRLQAAADVLVLVTSGARTGEATGKLFEYLAAGRPILALAQGSAAGDLVRAAEAGLVIPTRDTDAAEAALRRILTDGLPVPTASLRAAFAYPALAERYEQVIERAISAGARRAGAEHG